VDLSKSQNPSLKEILNLHDENRVADGIALSLGDGFLYQNNPIFRSIRDQFLKMKFSFTDEDFCHYTVMPYVSLTAILKEKKVPYFDNVTVLKEIERNHPGRFRCNDIIKVKPNYVLHESSHCLAEGFLQNFRLQDTGISTESKKAFRLVMAESMANTVESLANGPNETAVQRLFFEVNSYVIHNKKSHTQLKQSLDLLGPRPVFHLMYISYLFSNCLFPEVTHKQFHQILDLIIPENNLLKKAQDSQSVKRLFNHAFELSMDFRLQTTGFFCALSGLETNVIKLLQLDIIKIIENTDCVQIFFEKANSLFE
jgi:hypothetical protein